MWYDIKWAIVWKAIISTYFRVQFVPLNRIEITFIYHICGILIFDNQNKSREVCSPHKLCLLQKLWTLSVFWQLCCTKCLQCFLRCCVCFSSLIIFLVSTLYNWLCFHYETALAKAQQLLLDQQEREYLVNQITAAKGWSLNYLCSFSLGHSFLPGFIVGGHSPICCIISLNCLQ